MKKQPEVTAQTKQGFINAFWDLYKEKRIEKITVGEIARKAGTNRSTFYEYFTDIYELLDCAEQQLIDNIDKDMNEKLKGDFPTSHEEFSRSAAEFYAGLDDIVYILLGERGDPSFKRKLKERMYLQMKKVMNIPQNSPDFEYIASYVVSVLTGMVSCWYENGKQLKKKYMIEMCYLLLTEGIFGYTSKSFSEYAGLLKNSLE